MPMTPALWTNMFAALTPPEAVRTLARIGWPAATISCDHAAQMRGNDALIESCAQAAADTGIALPQMHLMLKADMANLDDAAREDDIRTVISDLNTCAALGIPVGVMHPGGYRDVDTYAEWDAMSRVRVESFKRLAEAAGERGVRLAVEHMYDAGGGVHGHRRFGGTVDDVLGLCAEVGSEHLGVCFDASHAHLQGMKLGECIRRCRKLLWATHNSDNFGEEDRHDIPGQGSVDWREVVGALKEVGYEGAFVLETWNLRTTGQWHDEQLELGATYALQVARSLLELY